LLAWQANFAPLGKGDAAKLPITGVLTSIKVYPGTLLMLDTMKDA
jgi:hypothetical protein